MHTALCKKKKKKREREHYVASSSLTPAVALDVSTNLTIDHEFTRHQLHNTSCSFAAGLGVVRVLSESKGCVNPLTLCGV